MFDTNDYDLPLVIYGGEGFSSLTQNITIGGFAGTGNTSIRHDQYMEQDIGNANPREGIIRNIARISLIMSGATLEYVFHPFSGLDISVGGMVGFGSLKFGLARTSNDVVWDLPDENYNTIAGLVVFETKTIPNPGQEFRLFGIKIRILQKDKNFLSKLRLWKEQEK